MQIDYETFLKQISKEAKCACIKLFDRLNRPGLEDRQGYVDALISAPTLVRYFFCKDRTAFDYAAAVDLFVGRVVGCYGLVHDCRYPWDQHYEFARARGFLFAVRLLHKLAAQSSEMEGVM